MHVNRWKTALSLVLFAALVAAPLAAQDWAGRGRAMGKVTTEDGEPIEGAKVTLHLPGRPDAGPEAFTTNKKGRWSYLGLDNGQWTIVVEKEGFMTSEGSFQVNEFGTAKPMNIEMQANPFAAVNVGQELIEKGEYAAARAEFQKVLPKMEPQQQAQIHALIGTTHYEEGDYASAIEEYETALADLSQADQTTVRLRLGDAYLQQGQFSEARQAYEKTLDQLGDEGRSQVLLAIARSYDQEGDREQAIATVERMLEQNPEDVQALQLIADLLGREGRDEEAQEYLDRIPEDEELPPDMLLNQGIRFYNNQKPEQALENFDRVIKQDPSLADAYYYRGLVYLQQGSNDKAKADFQKLLELAPDSQYAGDAKQFLDYLESQ